MVRNKIKKFRKGDLVWALDPRLTDLPILGYIEKPHHSNTNYFLIKVAENFIDTDGLEWTTNDTYNYTLNELSSAYCRQLTLIKKGKWEK